MRSILPVLLLSALVSALVSTQALASGLGASLTAVTGINAGRGHVTIELEASPSGATLAQQLGGKPDPARFRAIVEHGEAQVLSVQRLSDVTGGVYTVLAFDRSGSFAPYWGPAFDLAESFADALPPGQSAGVMTFHGEQVWHGEASSPAELRALLAQVQALGTLGSESETSLMSAVREGADRAAKSPAPARQLIVFTDAGEEGQVFSLDETTRYVRDLGVPIHPIVLKEPSAPGSKKAQAFATANDRMKKLATDSGGQHIHAREPSAATAALAERARAAQRLYRLSMRFCSVPAGDARFWDNLRVEALPSADPQAAALARTPPVPFLQHAGGDAVQPCSALPPPSSVVEPGDLSPPAVPPSLAADASSWWWVPLLLALLLIPLLLGVLLAVFLGHRSRRPAPENRPPAPPPAPPPLEPAAPAPPPAAPPQPPAPGPQELTKEWSNPLTTLPETRLMVEHGPPGLEKFYRLYKKEFIIGADAGRGADLVLTIPQISGRHARIQLFPSGAVFLIDEGSTNGTFLDDRRLAASERVPVQPGQRIRLSSQLTLRLEQPGKGAAASPPAREPVPVIAAPAPEPAPAEPVTPAVTPNRPARQHTIIQPLRRDNEP